MRQIQYTDFRPWFIDEDPALADFEVGALAGTDIPDASGEDPMNVYSVGLSKADAMPGSGGRHQTIFVVAASFEDALDAVRRAAVGAEVWSITKQNRDDDPPVLIVGLPAYLQGEEQ